MRVILAAVLLLGMAASAGAGTIGGVAFQDLDRNGEQDVGEPPLRGVRVQLMGADGTILLQTQSGPDGSFQIGGLADGQYVLSAITRGGFRASLPQIGADPDPIPNFPFGRPRYSAPSSLIQNLRRATSQGSGFRHVGLGDSIGFGFNFCGSLFGENGYFEPTTERLADATAAGVIGNKQAVLGYETSDLLDAGSDDDIFWTVDQGAQLVSISIGGNDFLGAEDGGDAAVAAALVTGRRNLQEILSSLVTELPGADIEINTVYDNLEGDDAFHNVWVPIWNQMLREAAWGQERRVNIAEIYPEYAHEEGGAVLGETGLICNDILGLDGIHPTNSGYDVHEEKLWQSFGGVTLSGGSDRLDIELGFLRPQIDKVAASFDDVGATTIDPGQALAIDDVGALVPSDGADFRLLDFQPTQVPNADLIQAILKVRYRTTGAPIDDLYSIEASVDGSFSAPGSTPSTWNTILPLVGSSANSGAEPLAYPDQPDYRTVAAPVYIGSPTSSDGTLDWPDLETLSLRIVSSPVGASDGYSIEVDAAWVELFVVRNSGKRGDEASGDGGGTASEASPAARPRTPSLRTARIDEAASLWRAGDAAGVRTLLDEASTHPGSRRALRALERIGIDGDRLARELSHPEVARRTVAVRLAMVAPLLPNGDLPESGLRALREILRHDERALRIDAARALARLRDLESLPRIVELALEAPSDAGFVRALAGYGLPAAHRALAEIATSPVQPPSVRRRAARKLAQVASPSLEPILRALLAADDLRVRRLGEAGLRQPAMR